MKKIYRENKYIDLCTAFYNYARYAYFKDDIHYRVELLREVKNYKNYIESKFDSLRNYGEDYSSLFMFLTNHTIYFHEFLLFAYKNILITYPEFLLRKNDENELLEFYIGNSKYIVTSTKTKIKNPNPGNIALSMIYENKNTDILEKKEIKIIDKCHTNEIKANISLYTPFILDNITEDEKIQLEIIVENVIQYMKDEIDKILNYILHLYTHNNIDWKVVVNDGLWIRNNKPKKRYFK